MQDETESHRAKRSQTKRWKGTDRLTAGGYSVDFIVQGFPGKSLCHGSLGWSSVVLLRGHERVALIDAGSMGMREMLVDRLAELGVRPAHVTDLLLTHAHHDHAINWTLFSKARIVIAKVELDWAVKQSWGETPVAELYARELQGWRTLHTAVDGEEVLPGVTALLSPGHTPGCFIYTLQGHEHDIIFTGDAAKNRAELVSGTTDMTYDPAVSAASIRAIWDLWRRRPGTVLVPGHDVPMVQKNGVPRYIDKHKAAINAWLGNDMKTTVTFDLGRLVSRKNSRD